MEQLLFKDHPSPMLIYDPGSLKILRVNKAFVEKYKYTNREIEESGLTIKEIRPRKDVPKLMKMLEDYDPDDITQRGVHRHQTKEGEVLYVQVTSQEVEYNGIDCRLVLTHDVSRSVEAERRSAKALQELRHHISNSPLASVKLNGDFVITEWSEQAERISGYGREEIVGKNIFDVELFTPSEEPKIKRLIETLVSGSRMRNQFETQIIHKNGDRLYVKVYSSSRRTESGELLSILTLIEDITERKKSEIKYQRLFENANDGILLLQDNAFVECNKKAEKLFKASRDEILGKHPSYFSPETQPDGSPSKEEAKKRIQKALKTGSNIFEWQHKTTEGDLIDVEVSLNKIVFPDGEYVQAILHDITERKQKERETEILLAEVHHRVKNNLAIISGLLELEAMNRETDTAVQRVIKQSKLRIQSMGMIHELLYQSGSFSNLKLGNYVSELLDKIYSTMGGEQKDVDMHVKSDDVPLNINQAIACGMIINELATNAFKYAFEEDGKGTLDVTLKETGGKISIFVQDNGPGLPASFNKMIENSLGHQIVNQLVKQLHGSIDVQSSAAGTRYQITFQREEKSGPSSSGKLMGDI